MAEVIRLDHDDQAALAKAGQVLARGGLVVYPTETLYGIAVDHANPQALARLAELKGRQPGKPFPLILASRQEADSLAAGILPAARALMARHWPGALTLVLAARDSLHPSLLSPDGGVGLRLSPHPVAAGLARALGRAITATSANLAGRPPVNQVADLDPALALGVDLILDNGPTPGGLPSTVLDARAEPWRVLRQGPVPTLP